MQHTTPRLLLLLATLALGIAFPHHHIHDFEPEGGEPANPMLIDRGHRRHIFISKYETAMPPMPVEDDYEIALHLYRYEENPTVDLELFDWIEVPLDSPMVSDSPSLLRHWSSHMDHAYAFVTIYVHTVVGTALDEIIAHTFIFNLIPAGQYARYFAFFSSSASEICDVVYQQMEGDAEISTHYACVIDYSSQTEVYENIQLHTPSTMKEFRITIV